MSLGACLIKHARLFAESTDARGRPLPALDTSLIREAADEYIAQGMPALDAERRAVDDKLAEVAAERRRIEREVMAQYREMRPELFAAPVNDAAADRPDSHPHAHLHAPSTPMLLARFAALEGKITLAGAAEDAKRILGLDGDFVFREAQLPQDVPARTDTDTGVIQIDLMQCASRAHAAQVAAEEILHAIDLVAPNTTISYSSKRLAPGGDIRHELEKHYRDDGYFAAWLHYPLGMTLPEPRIAAELFARMAVAYNGDPTRLQRELPLTHGAFYGLYRLVETNDRGGESVRSALPWFTQFGTRGGHDAAGDHGRLGADGGGRTERGHGTDPGLARYLEKVAAVFDGEAQGRLIPEDQFGAPPSGGVFVSTAPARDGPAFQRGARSGGLSVAAVEHALQPLLTLFPRLRQAIEVVQSIDAIDGEAVATDARGVYLGDSKQIHVVADNIASISELTETVYHEGVGHLAIQELLEAVEPGLYARLLKQVSLLDRGGNTLVRPIADEVRRNYSQPLKTPTLEDLRRVARENGVTVLQAETVAPLLRRLAKRPALNAEAREMLRLAEPVVLTDEQVAAEVLAIMAERRLHHGAQTSGPIKTILDKFVVALRELTRLILDRPISDGDVLVLLRAAERHLAESSSAADAARMVVTASTQHGRAAFSRPAGKRATARTVVSNGYTYTMDKLGRTIRITGWLTLNLTQARNHRAQREAGGKDRLPTDQGGHFYARIFNGPLEKFNHFAQDGNFNRSAYRALEILWRKALEADEDVYVDIVPEYKGNSLRPAKLRISYKIGKSEFNIELPNQRGG